MPTLQIAQPQSLVLGDIDWQTYSRLLRAFAHRTGVRLAYDRGNLEIMSPLLEHESDARFLGRLVVAATEELDLPVKCGGSTTFRRRAKRRGLEPDDCYWIASESSVRGKRVIDLRVDPPPDLAIEVDVTHKSLNRMTIYAALRVPEVWRLSDQGLAFHTLGADGKYAEGSHSQAFPFMEAGDVAQFLGMRDQLDENAVVKAFRIWIHTQTGANSGGAADD
jgi:Uma2 family endonuclease